MLRPLLVLALLCASGVALAQEAVVAPRVYTRGAAPTAASRAALAHLEADPARYGLSAADLGAYVVTDEYRTPRLGVTHVYLRQAHAGLEVLGATASAHVADDGAVARAHSRFVPGLAQQRVAAPVPALTLQQAIEAAARALDLPGAPVGLTVLSAADGVAQAQRRSGGLLARAPIEARLVWVPDADGALRLAWAFDVATVDGAHWWDLAVDAHTGRVLRQADWTVWEAWPSPPPPEAAPRASYAPVRDTAPVHGAAAASPLAPDASQAGTYRVVAFPAESPSHGPISLVANVADAVASPRGWHDDGDATYTITRGNNVFAYEDRNREDAPGYSPDGGSALRFDFGFEDNNLPGVHQDFAITNLFYGSNRVHDILWHYGFDEAAGNFQETNFGAQGEGGDPVLAEAQDGGDLNNANFSTPPDGRSPRMQMFLWTAAQFEVTAPADVAGTYPAGTAAFGPSLSGAATRGPVVVLESADPAVRRGCADIPASAGLDGRIALIERGDCFFSDKVRNAQRAGATAVVVYNHAEGGEEVLDMGAPAEDELPYLLSEIEIPSVFVQRSTGLLLREADGVAIAARRLARDSGLDNGVVIHEVVHGLTNRLTGGPSEAGCLDNAEQMGEGWSDYYALMLTMTAGDAAADARGIATYLEFETPDGPGIRPAPYSTDLGVNPLTYADVADSLRISQPHGIGTVFGTMLWEMTWALIDRYGFDPDLIGGTGGNTLALQLVTDALKLQPCDPGFVDARDALLEADRLAHDSAHHALIWTAFAKRGLGANASQGDPDNRADGVADFTVPQSVDERTDPDAPPYRLSAAHPNPTRGTAKMTLALAAAQRVRVTAYDVLGRRVATLLDGLLEADAVHTIPLDGAGLGSGAYILRIEGEAFAATRRLVVVR